MMMVEVGYVRLARATVICLAGTIASCSASVSDGAVVAKPETREPDASVDSDGPVPAVSVEGGGSLRPDASPQTPSAAVDKLYENRERLLGSYLDWLRTRPGRQSNGLLGSELPNTCILWQRLGASARAVFLTITARLQGSWLPSERSSRESALFHVRSVYVVLGGERAAGTETGRCGGSGNRMFVATDVTLHDALVRTANGAVKLNDVRPSATWRASLDLAGPHLPFDTSAETMDGAPRAQAHFFRDAQSRVELRQVGNGDLGGVVDGRALEVDLDYDCPHNSNPLCAYTSYGPLCIPQPSRLGIDLYEATYGPVERGYIPSTCER